MAQERDYSKYIKEKLIKADIASIENRVRHAFNQGYDLGFKDGKSKQPNCSGIPTGSTAKIECDNTDCNNCVNHKYCDYEKFDAVMDNMLKHPSTTKNDLGVDCISRAEVNQVIEDYMDEQYHVLSDRTRERAFGAKAVMARINELPSVTPIRPKGHWIVAKGKSLMGWRNSCCSNCKNFYTNDWEYMNYCPNCGADMREVEE